MHPRFYRRRLPHIHVPGAVYFLTFRLSPKQPSTLRPRERDAVAEHIQRIQTGTRHAWVVMPDHVHLIYQPCLQEPLLRALQALKSVASHTFVRHHGRQAPVWQAESYDHIIRNERELRETIAYVEANPIRRELVAIAEDYPWSSASQRRWLGSAPARGKND